MKNRKVAAFLICAFALSFIVIIINVKNKNDNNKPVENTNESLEETTDLKADEVETTKPNASEPETTEPETTKPEPKIVSITINAVGDMTLGINQKHSYEASFDQYYDLNGAEYFLKNVKALFEADDFTIGNLEGTLTTSNERMEKLWNHKGRPEYTSILTCASIEAVTLGNNHIMDYGQQGANDTIKYVNEAGLAYALSGQWENNYGLYETDKGITIGFVSVNEHYDESGCYPYLEEGYNTLRQAGADLVIACPHWGGDSTHVLEQEQYVMGRWCIDFGYDVVLGCHPHVLQGIEIYKGKYIVYSMGNFCYGGNKNPNEKDSMIWQQTFTFTEDVLSDTTAKVIPASLSSVSWTNDYSPIILTGDSANGLIDRLNSYCLEFGTKVNYDGSIEKIN